MAKKVLCEGSVTLDPLVMSGAAVFAGTRVPVKNLFDYLEAGKSVDDFLAAFDWVPRDFVERVLSAAYRSTFEATRAARRFCWANA